MLSNDLLTINKIAQGDIAMMDAIHWYIKLDKPKQRELMLLARMCLEHAGPNQQGVDYIIDRGYFNLYPAVREIFKERHYDQAIILASEVPDKDVGDSFLSFVELFRYFDEQRRKTECKDGCDHEWHNLTWRIRTDDVKGLADFYTLLGLTFTRHSHGSTVHYSAPAGQATLHIYKANKSNTDKGLHLHLKFTVTDFDAVITNLKEKNIVFAEETIETDKGVKAEVLDLEGRRVEIWKG